MDSQNFWYWQVQHFCNFRHKWINNEADSRSWKFIAHVNICRCCPLLCSKGRCNPNIYWSGMTLVDCSGRTQRAKSYWWLWAYPILIDYWYSCATMSSCRWQGRYQSDSIVLHIRTGRTVLKTSIKLWLSLNDHMNVLELWNIAHQVAECSTWTVGKCAMSDLVNFSNCLHTLVGSMSHSGRLC